MSRPHRPSARALLSARLPAVASLAHHAPLSSLSSLLALLTLSALTACDTGFGQPCELPKTAALSSACKAPTPPANQDEGDGAIQEYKVTCAVDNYPTCSTMSCLQYRGSAPYCSLRCSANSDCEESNLCCPLFGECGVSATSPDQMMSAPAGTCANGPCYCIRQSDLAR